VGKCVDEGAFEAATNRLRRRVAVNASGPDEVRDLVIEVLRS
jgi:hypothetical protein